MSQESKVQPGFYNILEMQVRFGRSRSWILLQTKTPEFPKPARLGKLLAWRRTDVERYIDGLPEASGNGLGAVASSMERVRGAKACSA